MDDCEREKEYEALVAVVYDVQVDHAIVSIGTCLIGESVVSLMKPRCGR